MKNLPVVLLLTLVLSSVAFGQTKVDVAKRVEKTNTQMKPVKEYVDGIMKFVEKEGKPHNVVADVSDYNNAKEPKWQWFDTQDAFEKDKRDMYTTAFIWKKDSKVVQVNFTLSSPSGDWSQFLFHTYYPNGQLARIDNELRTFLGDVIVNRVSYYDKMGKKIKNETTYRDLTTQKPMKKPESFQDIEADIYKKVQDLPFLKKTS